MKIFRFIFAAIIAIIFLGCPSRSPGSSIEMVLVPAGSFIMGSDDPDDLEAQPSHQVTLTQSFWIGKFPVTQEQFEAVMGTNPSHFTTANGRPPADGETDVRRPVEFVRWYETIIFANKLSIKDGFTPAYEALNETTGEWTTDTSRWGEIPTGGRRSTRWAVRIVPGSTGYRLPTEAQWEFAARGGEGSPGGFMFSGSNNADEVAWHLGNSGEKTREVGLLNPNSLGIHDMSGNVWEWAWDWFGSYTSTHKIDPMGPASGVDRVVRGGSWFGGELGLRLAVRFRNESYHRWGGIGFRLVRP
ncbi:MAG: formylglycine-generating enzyme family protein [Treponema sp.]|nr:formylglycine-generating enzyme family protein [Treponema sp.]